MKLKWLLALILLILNLVVVGLVITDQKNSELEKNKRVVTAPVHEASESAKNEEVTEDIPAEQEDQYAFRKTNWGMSKQDVQKSEEGNPIHDQENMVMYNASIAGMDASSGYLFTDGKLFKGVYMFNIMHTNENDFIADYDKLRAMMVKKYGQPLEDEKNWKDDLYQSDSQKVGFAVSLGHLVYYSTWETKDSNMILELTGDNYEINLRLSYWSKELKGDDNIRGNGL